MRSVAVLFSVVSILFAAAGAADILFHLGWAANWQAIPAGLFMGVVGFAFFKFIGFFSPIVDAAIEPDSE